MTIYDPPLRDLRFCLAHVTPLPEITALGDFAHVTPEVVTGVLDEAGRFAAEAVAPTNREGDAIGARLVDGGVVMPDALRRVYQQYVDAGWGAIQHPVEHGGGAFPLTVANAIKEMITSANMALSLCPLLTTGAVHLLTHHGSEQQQQVFLPNMVAGEWAGTMNLTEPEAGSDLGAVTTRAVPQEDGTHRITGQKIYITYGDHDLTDNIIHLVLARVPGSPPGTRGLSLFIVPKLLVGDDGSLGERNDVQVVSLEHKLGIHASPTCVLAYGEQGDGAIGYLVGEPGSGMRQMFTMMNDARLAVGVQGLAVAERAYQQALAFAQERRQGQAPGAPRGEQSPIIEHADVRRMLLTMKASIEAVRGLCSATAHALDLAAHHPDATTRGRQQGIADLLTPVSKAWGTEVGVEVASLAIQVHGGMGYIEETGVAQHVRDARIAPIYEGTNGIQAIDLVARKLPREGGAVVRGLLEDIQALGEHCAGVEPEIGRPLLEAIGALREATDWMVARSDEVAEAQAGAAAYLRLLAVTVGGWKLATGALAARDLLARGATGDFDEAFLEARLTIARVFATQVLSQAVGLRRAATAGAADLFAVAPAQLGP